MKKTLLNVKFQNMLYKVCVRHWFQMCVSGVHLKVIVRGELDSVLLPECERLIT